MSATSHSEHASAGLTEQPPKRRSLSGPARRWRWLAWLLLFVVLAAALAALAYELRTSHLQSRELSRYAATLTYQLEAGPSNAIRFPAHGPFDHRLGYSRLPQLMERLQRQDFTVQQQTQFSTALLNYSQHGFFIPYAEKTRAGLSLNDCRAEPVYDHRYPQRHYDRFDDIAPQVLATLLFIENRALLSTEQPLANPAVDWLRFARAALSQVGRALSLQDDSAGGSTLATQIEKFRHSPGGRTHSPAEKIRQMISASVRAYQQGPHTLAARRQVALSYLNSVPLAAAPGHGEVHGLGDGLWLWFGAELERVNTLLDPTRNAGLPLAEQGLALRRVMALMIAQRRPSHYLFAGRDELEALTDSYLRVQADAGLIGPALRDAALAQRLNFRDFSTHPVQHRVEQSKLLYASRGRLASLLGLNYYELDRLDLQAETTLNGRLQQEVSLYLQQLADPDVARSIGLYGKRLLSPDSTAEVRYSFTLFERDEHTFKVRVQTDNTGQPFDINESSKLELGSTAKLRVLATYLEMVAELHQLHADKTLPALREVSPHRNDVIGRWAIDHLMRSPDRTLSTMLSAALKRQYSASPYERFFTGGGLHTFANFRKEDNRRRPTLIEALRESINLPFIRLMRDLVRHTLYQDEQRARLLTNDKEPQRLEYLSRFADREGTVFLRRFWRKYQGKTDEERLQLFFDGLRPLRSRLATSHRYLLPEASLEQFNAFMRERLPWDRKLSDSHIEKLYHQHGPGAWSLPDQGYIARRHPLEMWLLSYLRTHPDASFGEVVKASAEQRQEVYGWLFKTRHRSARDSRMRTMLEMEAFSDIHERWQQLGFPFDRLVPSLATAIGSSGDRPAALAELVGIILNDGVRLPVVRINALHFAEHTPYEVHLGPDPHRGERVMESEVAAALRDALSQVVEGGTARRLHGSFTLSDGTPLVLGGKTGTGDNRIETVTRYGQVIKSEARNRTATFVFYLGERHFGTLTAYVPGEQADDFHFTSSLPVQVLKGMEPILRPYLQPGAQTQCQQQFAISQSPPRNEG
ncbi:transglycosylase domain-containing protein [Oceanimonas sp. CHS3-5]|uniref:transglycosylase domain-containing protein n=1 Tax=Oceanimonas sp. CHS3-5 TaxID=3068186 RepID=UPI00273F3715|nr:transglycosylase domain-containing protein [Oceanimonas sp. CHS3-5]MDP5291346.1 transglycosylase domain-containing protein [Oceanimonas sp. CHS3-5]